MPKDKNEVREFAQEVGAEEPEEGTEFYLQWRKRCRCNAFTDLRRHHLQRYADRLTMSNIHDLPSLQADQETKGQIQCLRSKIGQNEPQNYLPKKPENRW